MIVLNVIENVIFVLIILKILIASLVFQRAKFTWLNIIRISVHLEM